MNQQDCQLSKHDFKIYAMEKGLQINTGDLQPAIFECTKCKLKVFASDVTAIAMLKHVRSWRVWIIPLFALLVSIGALIVSVVALGQQSQVI